MMMKKVYRSFLQSASLFLLLLLAIGAHAQSKAVTGSVTDEAGAPMPGVNVVVKGTTNGTTTSATGSFTISVAEADVLQFSFIGFVTQEIRVGNQTKIDIKLAEDVATLTEVVVVGYGTQKKEDLTTAVSSVDGDMLRSMVSANADQSLQGKVAGVMVTQNSGQPGSAVSIRIRGTTSITGGNEPLYVIDGIQVSGGAGSIAGFDWAGGSNGQSQIVSPLANLNPNDIESIEVLKDAAAAAIYGSRAANGVIIVTTKRGRAGDTKIGYSGYYALQEVPKYLDMMDLPQYAAYQYSISEEIPSIVPDERYADPSLLGPGTDWQREIFQVAPMQSHQISAEGGGEKAQYYLSGGYFSQDGIIEGSGFERFSVKLNLDSRVNKFIKVGTSLNYAITQEVIGRSDGGDGIIAQALQMPPSTPVKDMDGNYAGPDGGSAQVKSNPVAVSRLINNDVRRNSLQANFFAELDLTKGLAFRTEYAINDGHALNKVFVPTYEWGALKNPTSSLRHKQDDSFFYIWRNYFTYTFEANDHHIVALLGQEAQRSDYQGSDFVKVNLTSNDITTPNQGEPQSIGGYEGANSIASYYARINYNYGDRYYLTGIIRRDGSSRFGPNNRWGNFPSISFAWRIANESFMPKSDFLTDLKLRASYGKVGNQEIGNYAYGSALQSIPNTAFGTTYINARVSNPNLKWETLTSYGAGLDATVLDGRIDLSFDYYKKFSDGLLLETQAPAYVIGTIIRTPYANFGKIENNGFEVAVTGRIIQGKKFTWTTDANYSHNRNLVKEINNINYQSLYWYSGFQSVTRTMTGEPVGQFYGYETEGVFKDQADILGHAVQVGTGETNFIHQRDGVWIGDLKFKDQNGDNRINELDQVAIGNPNPKGSIGFNNNFTYGNFSLAVNITSVFGFDVFNFQKSRNQAMNSAFDNQLADVANRARFEMIDPAGSDEDINNFVLLNPDAEIPRFSQLNVNANGRMSDMWIEDGSYVRIQNVRLSYALPSSLVNKVKLTRAMFYFNGQNLKTFTNYSGYDPEIGALNQNALRQNIDMGRIPAPRVYTFGVELGF